MSRALESTSSSSESMMASLENSGIRVILQNGAVRRALIRFQSCYTRDHVPEQRRVSTQTETELPVCSSFDDAAPPSRLTPVSCRSRFDLLFPRRPNPRLDCGGMWGKSRHVRKNSSEVDSSFPSS